jgi:hypothetical protein
MADTPVAAMGPLEFTDEGEQFVIPLSALYFDSGITLKTDSPLYAQHRHALDGWLAYLQSNGLVTPAPQPPPTAAMVITAAGTGSSGNDIAIAFTNVQVDPVTQDTTFDATLTQTDTYPGLTPETLTDVIGTAPDTGSRPGLIYVSSGGTPAQPANGAVALNVAGPPFTFDVSDGQGATAFSLRTRSDDADAADTAVTITAADDPSSPTTFTLTATWTKQATGIHASDLGTSFAYEITVAAPPGGQLLPPAPGRVVLRGGSDLTGPTAASVTVATQ